MQDKELEKIIQEKANKSQMRDFSLVWDEIKDEIKPKQKEKKAIWKKKFFLIFAPALLVFCIAISPLFFQKPTLPEEKVYYSDELGIQTVTVQETLDGLSSANLLKVNLNKYYLDDTRLYCTDDLKVKGAQCKIFYDEGNLSFYATMILYDKSVDTKVNLDLYDTICQVNSANVYYKSNSINGCEYSVYAICDGVQYLIEYTGATDNLMEFLTDFFA